MLGSLLRVPLTVKLLVANGLLLGSGVVGGALLGRPAGPLAGAHGALIVVLALGGMIVVNGVLVKVALSPLRRMHEAARGVARGNLSVRIPRSPVGDEALDRLILTFNRMVRGQAGNRSRRDGLVRDLLAAGEQERKAMADSLLAGPSQALSTALLLLRNGEEDPPSAAAAEQVRSALEDLRTIASTLHPPELGELGLGTAVRALVRSRLEPRDVPCAVEIQGTGLGLEPGVALEAYRLVQGVVELAEGADRLDAFRIRIVRRGPSLDVRAEIQGTHPLPDDGDGEGVRATLRRISERARILGGSLEVRRTGPGRIRLRSRLPVPPPPEEPGRLLPIVSSAHAAPNAAAVLPERPYPPRASRTAQ